MAVVETGLGMLIAPLFTIGAAFGIFAIAKDEHHHVGRVTVSQTMADHGFTEDIATKALKALMKDSYFKINDSFESPVLPLLEDQTTEIIAEAVDNGYAQAATAKAARVSQPHVVRVMAGTYDDVADLAA